MTTLRQFIAGCLFVVARSIDGAAKRASSSVRWLAELVEFGRREDE